jgi:hypothetical protein
MTNGKFCLHLRSYFKRHLEFRSKMDFQTVLRTKYTISQDRLELDGDPGFQLLTEEEIVEVIFLYFFSSALPVLLNVPFICFVNFFVF